MNLIRTDQQVAMNAMYTAIRKTAHHYLDAASSLDDSALITIFQEIVEQRKILSEKVRELIRSRGDLPPEPDQDRETLEQLAYHMGSSLSANPRVQILKQRLNAEQEVADLAAAAREVKLNEACTALVDEVEAHVQTVTDRLQALVEEYTNRP